MTAAPKGMRLHIGIFGRRNVGKSQILNSLIKQNVSIVSEIAGTTTDPVEKAIELQPVGPVLFVDTAGIDDIGSLGKKRIEKTVKVFDRTDIAVLVWDNEGWGDFERKLFEELDSRKIPIIAVFNKSDLDKPSEKALEEVNSLNLSPMIISAKTGEGLDSLREEIIRKTPEEFLNSPALISDLVPAGEVALLVVPIDLEAPKGRLILPQVQTIRDILDNDSIAVVVKERELREALNRFNKPPHIVVTDSQAFLKVSADVPRNVKLTSFSILFARFKGNLDEFVKGATAIENLKENSKILICESCTHHPVGDDIGRIKIPRWLTQYTGQKLHFDYYTGHDFPANITDYDLLIHCGACMTNRREILSRIAKAKDAGVPITNYGLAIAYSLGIFERALEPFPSAKEIFESSKNRAGCL